ncbi:hypothetical protein [Micromonospora sp. U21]|jgi:hypothetical protein|uniref:hypothetical protein n=1 Tax=Micromonospora sp. U21 TaxID=2824899 RepID=UPI001B39C5B2|nr:hypothetical protein [Micromonospora sp. U21]MBQ0903019.1 hypothetical protein [Micromonospora sp. U21]
MGTTLSGDSGGHYRKLSHWLSTLDDPLTPRPALPGDADADVAIVGSSNLAGRTLADLIRGERTELTTS